MLAQGAFLPPVAVSAGAVECFFLPGPSSASAAPRAASRRVVTRKSPRRPSVVVLPTASAGSANGASFPLKVAAVVAAGLVALSPAVDMVAVPGLSSRALAARGGGNTFSAASGDVNKDCESILRWALPIKNEPVRDLQATLESAISDARSKNWGKVESGVRKANALLNRKTDAILAGVPQTRRDDARSLLTLVADNTAALTNAVNDKNIDKFVDLDKGVLRNLGMVEETMVTEFPYSIPKEYDDLPRLMGRATVELTVRKASGESFDLDGTYYKEGQMTIVVDGYHAPLSGGAFVDLASKGFYDNLPVLRSDGFIVQSGKPKDADGYVADGKVRTVPLELFARGDSEPLYGMTLEDDGRGAAATVLPFSSYGTLALARDESEPNTASSQYFWFLFEPDLTPAGRNLMDGSWSVFGYTTKGQQFLRGLQRGDLVVSAKVVGGLEYLKANGS